MAEPLDPIVDSEPRLSPPHIPIAGRACRLEPLNPSHGPDLWRAASGADETWAYLGYGPFASPDALSDHLHAWSASTDPLFWAVRVDGAAKGWLSLLDIQPDHAAIELGHIWFSPSLQRTRAATEAMVLLLFLAAGHFGYRRLVWKCNAMNTASRRAAIRLGFVYEGTLRCHMIVKGRNRDTAYYSIIPSEWPRCAAAYATWLDDRNFRPDGSAIRSLSELTKGASRECSG